LSLEICLFVNIELFILNNVSCRICMPPALLRRGIKVKTVRLMGLDDVAAHLKGEQPFLWHCSFPLGQP